MPDENGGVDPAKAGQNQDPNAPIEPKNVDPKKDDGAPPKKRRRRRRRVRKKSPGKPVTGELVAGPSVKPADAASEPLHEPLSHSWALPTVSPFDDSAKDSVEDFAPPSQPETHLEPAAEPSVPGVPQMPPESPVPTLPEPSVVPSAEPPVYQPDQEEILPETSVAGNELPEIFPDANAISDAAEPVGLAEPSRPARTSEPLVTEQDEESLSESTSKLDTLTNFLAQARAVLGAGFLKNCIIILVTAVLLFLGYYFQLHQTVYKFANNLINPSKPPAAAVQVREEDLNQWGIQTALIFAKNKGSVADIVPPAIKTAFFFGKLAEPQAKGETGITPAYYFGLLRDVSAETVRFIDYLKNLRALQDLYQTDVYAMLDQTTARDKKLLDYLAELKAMRESSDTIRREIAAQIDDSKISYNSLEADRTRLENDFFVAVANLAGEKSDFLLKSFIDVKQKQSALKARQAALEKVLEYYVTALKRLDVRIEAVDKNRDALIQGVHVVDIPGANLNIILKP